MQKLTIKRPDDWHLHLRDGEMLKAVLPHTAQDFGRAIIMPNLVPPVTTTKMAVGGQSGERSEVSGPPTGNYFANLAKSKALRSHDR